MKETQKERLMATADDLFKQGLVFDEMEHCEKAFECFQNAATQGNIKAMYMVGLKYSRGKGVVKDLVKGVQWIKKAADQGYEDAINLLKNIGVDYTPQKPSSSGGSTPVKPVSIPTSSISTPPMEKKLSPFEELCIKAKQGDAMAYFKLGEAYEKGDGVQKDIVKAKEWYRKASEQDENSIAKAIGNAKLVVLN